MCNGNLAFLWHLRLRQTIIHCWIQNSKLSQLAVGVWQSEDKHHITLKGSNLQLVELRRKINVSKEERCLGFT